MNKDTISREEMICLMEDYLWNLSAVERDFGIGRKTIERKLKQLGIKREPYRHPKGRSHHCSGKFHKRLSAGILVAQKERYANREKKHRRQETIKKHKRDGIEVHVSKEFPDGYLINQKCIICGETYSTKDYPYKEQLRPKKTCGSSRCQNLLQKQTSNSRRLRQRGKLVEVKTECLRCGKVMKGKIYERQYNGTRNHQDAIKSMKQKGFGNKNLRSKFCSEKCTRKYHRENLTDAFVLDQIREDVRRAFGTESASLVDRSEVTQEMIDDKRLCLKAMRAWREVTGKRLNLNCGWNPQELKRASDGRFSKKPYRSPDMGR